MQILANSPTEQDSDFLNLFAKLPLEIIIKISSSCTTTSRVSLALSCKKAASILLSTPDTLTRPKAPFTPIWKRAAPYIPRELAITSEGNASREMKMIGAKEYQAVMTDWNRVQRFRWSAKATALMCFLNGRIQGKPWLRVCDCCFQVESLREEDWDEDSYWWANWQYTGFKNGLLWAFAVDAITDWTNGRGMCPACGCISRAGGYSYRRRCISGTSLEDADEEDDHWRRERRLGEEGKHVDGDETHF